MDKKRVNKQYKLTFLVNNVQILFSNKQKHDIIIYSVIAFYYMGWSYE